MESLRELKQLMARRVGPGPVAKWQSEALSLRFTSLGQPSAPGPQIYEPLFALIVQGEKELVLGDRLFTCKKGAFMVVSVELPVTFRVSVASPAQPYMALVLTLDPARVASLLLEAPAEHRVQVETAALGVSDTPDELLEAVVRLVRLLDHPRDLPVLGPIFEKEILWRLLCSEQGQRLRQIGLADSRLSQIGRAMRFMRQNYREPLPIEALARLAAMSPTSFHRHFRAIALMSPLQYQKQIRLQVARARLLNQTQDIATVGQAVGYDSASQFSREYKRAYGSPPGQDARSLRAANRAAHASK